MSPAEELRSAAQKLRKMAAPTTRGPWAVADCDLYPRWIMSESHEEAQANGDWAVDVAKTSADDDMGLEISDADWAWMAFASPALAEPLAGWLDWAAIQVENHPLDPAYGGMPDFRWCLTCQDDEPSCALATDRALAVARAINGGDV